MFSKNGKLFGKISVIDLLVLVLVVVLAFGVYLRFSGNSTTQFVTGETYQRVVRVENVRTYTIAALAKGGKVYDASTKEYIGTITDVTSEPGSSAMTLTNGSRILAPMENRYHAYVTIAFDGKESGDGYYTAANQQISVGGTLQLRSKFSECEGKIVTVSPAN